jgi:HEAT repeat protein
MTQQDPTLDDLLQLLHHDDPVVRASAVNGLGAYRDPSTAEALMWLMGDDSLWVRCNAAETLGKLRHETAVIPLVAFLRRGTGTELDLNGPPDELPIRFHRFVRQPDPVYSDWLAAQGVSMPDEGFSLAVSARLGLQHLGLLATDALIDLLDDDNPYTRYVAWGLLNIMCLRNPVQTALIRITQTGNPRQKQGAALAMRRIGNFGAVATLITLLTDPSPQVVRAAVGALGEIRDPRAVGPLQALARRDDQWQTIVGAALINIHLQPPDPGPEHTE